MLRLAYSKQAIRALRRMPANQATLIRFKITSYAKDLMSMVAQVRKLRGREGYRLRVGQWRVIFDQDGTVLSIIEIGPRGGIYQ